MLGQSIQYEGYDRVRHHTAPIVNDRIDRATRESIDQVTSQGPVAIGRRLAELDREWDVDRALMANFVAVGGLGFVLGVRRRSLLRSFNGWQKFTSVQLGFLALHALVGWCPPASLFRRLGFRTQREIQNERNGLISALRREQGAGGVTP